MSSRECNYCYVQGYKKTAKARGHRVIIRPSSFMGGFNVWMVPKGQELPPKEAMIEPCNKYPNGNGAYANYHRGWFMGIGDHCAC